MHVAALARGGWGEGVLEGGARLRREWGLVNGRTHPPLPGARQPAPAGPVTGYFYLLSLTVQAQGATNCGSRLRKLAHESPSDCSGLVAAASWLRVRAGRPGPAGKGSVAPLLGCVGVRMGTPKLREARGPQKGGWGRRCRLEHGARGVAVNFPPNPTSTWVGSE